MSHQEYLIVTYKSLMNLKGYVIQIHKWPYRIYPKIAYFINLIQGFLIQDLHRYDLCVIDTLLHQHRLICSHTNFLTNLSY